MEITPNSTVTHSSGTSTTRAVSDKNQQPSQGTTNFQPELQLSSTSQALTQAFQQAVDWLQQEAVEPFQGRMDQLGTASVNIDVGRYNLHLVDQKANELLQTFGRSVDLEELKNQLIQGSGITTENPLNATNRKDLLTMNVSGLLLESDVQALTDVYIYAKESGLDAEQVNGLGFFMGVYRQSQQTTHYFHPPTEPADPATIQQAQAIYSSKETPLVQFESGFLEQMLHPEKSLKSFSKVVDLDFLQKLTGTGAGGDVFLPLEQPPKPPTTATSDSTTNLSKDELQAQLAAWLDQHWAQQSSLSSQLLGLNQVDQQDLWTLLRGMFA
ncbi:MAG: hypothetical protein IBX50_17825 [Marinospirillum sp.]|uniref:hypothetical protein n=1 Tax=Marinospirillum sp. TaxID=2183934 RepID=UPI0019E18E38|nr:hypothetical protein [Marinospirillum sp.]MBE0508547.1 hypothetical protein [Marinospirillum sp.]